MKSGIASVVALLLVPALTHAQAPESLAPPGPPIAQPPTAPSSVSMPTSNLLAGDDVPGYERLQFRASYLLWWLNRDHNALPVLTTGGAGGGALGQSDTRVLLQAGDVGPSGAFSGAVIGGHYWFDAAQWFGLDAQVMFLAKRTGQVLAAGDANGAPRLSIPFFDLNAVLPGPSFTQIATPGAVTGQVQYSSSTRLWGTSAALDLPSFAWGRLQVAGLIGFRTLDLMESYGIIQDVASVGQQPLLSFQGAAIPGTDRLRIADSFDTHNMFYGANFVLRTEYRVTDNLALAVSGQFAVGQTHSTLNVSGSTLHLAPLDGTLAVVQSATGGLFAQSNNIGRWTKSSTTVIPEAEAHLAWAITSWAELTVGGNFLYWNKVLRPAGEIPGTINTTTAPSQATFGGGGAIPGPPVFQWSDLKAFGVNAGLTVRF